MKIAVLVYRSRAGRSLAELVWVDGLAQAVLHTQPVPHSPNLGLLSESDCALVSYTEHASDAPSREVLDVYRLSDWRLRGRLEMDCRAHFNLVPRWSTFLPSPDPDLVYVYKARTLGDHQAEDFICGLRLSTLEFTPWNQEIPECVAGWSLAGGTAHVQMLFVADGLHLGQLPKGDALDQKVAFWLGSQDGMGPAVCLGPRPLAHSDLGHARALLCSQKRPLTVVVCNDGLVHLIDPVDYRHVARQRVQLGADDAMPLFAALLDPEGRTLYVGASAGEARYQGLIQRVVVHDLDSGRRLDQWELPEPLAHMTLSQDGTCLVGAASQSGKLWLLDARNGRTRAAIHLGGSPRYVLPGSPCRT